MTRIVAGFAGSLPLAVPKSGTRPTSDRVREAIFSALDSQDAVRHARVLDLYAGSGALGLEAASRGAKAVTLVEKSFGAAAMCRKNADALLKAAPKRDAPTIKVSSQAVQSFLAGSPASYDLVFLDPPYELTDAELAANLVALAPRLEPDALVVVERSSRSAEPDWSGVLDMTKRKDYGDTTVWYAQPVEVAGS